MTPQSTGGRWEEGEEGGGRREEGGGRREEEGRDKEGGERKEEERNRGESSWTIIQHNTPFFLHLKLH